MLFVTLTAIAQIAGYLPWIPVFFKQANAVSHGYWIPLTWGDTVTAPLVVQFNGRLSTTITVIFTAIMYVYLAYQIICNKKQGKPIALTMFCLAVHFILYFSMIIVTVLIKPIMYYRYMLITTGVLIFPFAYYLANSEKKHQKVISLIVVLIILILGIYNNVIIVKETYKPVNGTEVEYVKSQYQDNTIILYKDIYHATNIFVQMPEYNWYLYNIDEKHDLQPFENFSPPLKIIFEESDLQNYKGRIILIDHEGLEWYNEMVEKYKLKEIARNRIRTTYRGSDYQIITVEK